MNAAARSASVRSRGCGGIAEYFGLDPTIIRLVWLFAVLFYGSGVLAYIVCWIVIPD